MQVPLFHRMCAKTHQEVGGYLDAALMYKNHDIYLLLEIRQTQTTSGATQSA